jgi:feruloyl esterase
LQNLRILGESFALRRSVVRIGLLWIVGASLASSLGIQANPAAAQQLPPLPERPQSCSDSLKKAFKPDQFTTVRFVRQFKRGDDVNLDGKKSGVVAAVDLCAVKINVGPGNQGPSQAPSTSEGIGIEVWLPAPDAWNSRLHVLGGGGFAGNPEISSLDRIGSVGAMTIANREHSVSAGTDTGHVQLQTSRSADEGGGSFGINPDGTLNKTLWNDFAAVGFMRWR